jgi:hypothetical protein
VANKNPTPEELKITPEMLASKNYPKTAFYLVMVGAMLMIAQGIVCIFFRSLYYWIEIDFLAGLGWVLVGIILAIDGLIVSGGAGILVMKPELRKSAAVSIIIFALFGLLLGGGWVIGSVLAIIGGILAMTWKSPSETMAEKPKAS